MSAGEHRLDGGWQTVVHRVGEEVLRASGPQSATVVTLLRHLHDHGVGFAPEPLGPGSLRMVGSGCGSWRGRARTRTHGPMRR